MKSMAVILVFLFSFLILVSFFLAWVSVNSSAIGIVSQALNIKSDTSLTKISGFQVPILANRQDSRFMAEIIRLFSPGVTDTGKKSWLIWGVPLLALAISYAYFFLRDNKWFNLAVGITGVLIFAVGVYKLKAVNLDKIAISINTMPGLWFVLYGYLLMGLVCLFKFFKPRLI